MAMDINLKQKDMPIKISNTSKEIVEDLIRNEFHSIDFKMDYIYRKSDKLINLAKELQLDELVNELENALK